ncbi:MAG: CRISPR-associated endonuclease Cas2 [Methylohalobius sp.]|nr:CRISPR-associated endonuclease Cas2 [Methylohalobius sp.]
MSLYEPYPHLVAYDISDPKRLYRVHRYLKKLGIPLQYSVFLLHITPIQRKQIVFRLNRLIDPRADDVRIYPLPKNPDWQWWGRPIWMDGAILEGLPLPEGMGGAKFKT